MRKVAVISIHGIGSQSVNFAEPFNERLVKAVSKIDKNIEVRCFNGWWQSAVEQQELKHTLNLKNLSWKKARRTMITYIGDAIAYQPTDGASSYGKIHERIDDVFADAYDFVGEEGSVVVVAHSLGSIIVSNYIWDVQNPSSSGNRIFKASLEGSKAVDKIKEFMTFGCPLLLYSIKYQDGGSPIKVAKWTNVYTPSDVVGYPLKNINEKYNTPSITDVPMNVGSLWSRFTPLSHGNYMDDKGIVNLVAKHICAL